MKQVSVNTHTYQEKISYNVFYGDEDTFDGDKVVDDKLFVIENMTDENFAKGVATGAIYAGGYSFAYVVKNVYSVSIDSYELIESKMVYEVYRAEDEEFFTEDDEETDPSTFS